MLLLIVLFIFIFNLAPAFAPPTWAVLSYIQITYHPNVYALAILGAVAATCGRLLLAKFSDAVLRRRFLSLQTQQNLDSVKEEIIKHKNLSLWMFVFYAFSPLPSNQLFLAYGLTDLKLRLIALPFFFGRLVSYLFWIILASEVTKRVAASALVSGNYFKSYFIVVQILSLAAVYIFTKLDWKKIFTERKIGWIKK